MFSRYSEFAKRNIRRSPFQAIAACMIMLLTFLALSIFSILAAGSQAILRYYESKPQVIAFFKDSTTPEDIQIIQNALKEEIKVTGSKFVSKEEALEIYKQRNKNDPTLLELVTANILPASLEVSTQSPEDLAVIAELLAREPVVDQVLVPQDVVENLTTATRIIRIVGISVVTFLILFSILIILMVIGFKLRLKRNEIEIMLLIGAPYSFIRAPFILEGMFYSLFGALISWVLVYILLWYFTPFLQGYLGEVDLLPVNFLFMLALLGLSILVGILIGGLGSLWAVKRYLHV